MVKTVVKKQGGENMSTSFCLIRLFHYCCFVSVLTIWSLCSFSCWSSDAHNKKMGTVFARRWLLSEVMSIHLKLGRIFPTESMACAGWCFVTWLRLPPWHVSASIFCHLIFFLSYSWWSAVDGNHPHHRQLISVTQPELCPEHALTNSSSAQLELVVYLSH